MGIHLFEIQIWETEVYTMCSRCKHVCPHPQKTNLGWISVANESIDMREHNEPTHNMQS